MSCRGFVLFAMLIYMHVCSLVSLQSLLMARDLKSNIQRSLSVWLQQYQAMVVMQHVDEDHAQTCRVSRQSVSEIERREMAWWRAYGCRTRDGSNDYYYVRESMGIDRCSVIISSNNQQHASIIYRNTLLQVSRANPHQISLLQDTIAVPGLVQPVCGEHVRQIFPGRQMLRRISE